MKSLLSSVRMALEFITEYGDETEIATFHSDARDLMPWEDWRAGEWAEVVARTEFSPELAQNVILTYCGLIMLKLDEGAFCADTAVLISKRATDTVLNDEKFKYAVSLVKSIIENQQPQKIGHALMVLEQLENFKYQE